MTPQAITADCRIAVLGLGYVGLPLAHAISRRHRVTGFDIDAQRVGELRAGHDRNLSLSESQLRKNRHLDYSADPACLAEHDVCVITAPTPVDAQNQPDLAALREATAMTARYLRPGNLVIFESTVYPGATEEVCVPILEQLSGLALNRDFFVGYSPERVNPGDSAHSLVKVVKVVSGSTAETAAVVEAFYAAVISAGTYRASSIKVAEAAKVIENIQRDLNIALMNELAILFDKLQIDTEEVLRAAGSKWNFLPFRPGLVGGHCIGVDPYYLTYKAQQVDYHPEVILAGRRINDSMGTHVVDRVVRLMLSRRIHVFDSRVLVLGLAFKENCPDTRNSRVFDIISALQSYHGKVDVCDPWLERNEFPELIEQPQPGTYDAIVIAVAHRQFAEWGIERIRALGKAESVIFDVKCLFPADATDGRL